MFAQRPGCIKSYLNPNGLKYHLEKGTCIIDPLYRPPIQTQEQPQAGDKLASSKPVTEQPTVTVSQGLPNLPTPLLPVKSEPASPPLASSTSITRTGLRASQAAQQQQQQAGYYYAYSFPFQYGASAQIPTPSS